MARPRKPLDEKLVRVTCFVKPETAAYLESRGAEEEQARGRFASRILDRLAERGLPSKTFRAPDPR